MNMSYDGPILHANGTIDSMTLQYKPLFVLPFERGFNAAVDTAFYQHYWLLGGGAICLLYVLLIYVLQQYMSTRSPLTLRAPLIAWNAALALFSLLGAVRVGEEVLYQLRHEPFWRTVCYSLEPYSVAGYWSSWFALSKPIELLDTLFLILRKRPVIFLHWYHHVTVLLYTWLSGGDHVAAGRYFISVNYCVHAVMYAYYAARSAGVRVPHAASILVTLMQTSQMGFGLYICYTASQVKRADVPCQMSAFNMTFCLGIYASYFVLFCKFFYDAYLSSKRLNLRKVE